MKESFQCDLCTEEFRCKTHLKKHIMLNHEELYNELYNLTCPFCNNYFNNTYVLKNHIAEVHEKVKKHQCQFCEKAFGQAGTLKRHVVSVHEKIKNYVCELCEKDFCTKGELTKHISRL